MRELGRFLEVEGEDGGMSGVPGNSVGTRGSRSVGKPSSVSYGTLSPIRLLNCS